MPAIGRAHTFEGLGRGLGEFSRLLFGLQERREAEELAEQQRAEERDYRNRVLGLRERGAALDEARFQQGLEAQGIVQPEYREVPRVPSFSESLDVGVPGLGLAAGTTPPGPFEERMRTEVLGEAPSFETPEFVLAEGGYDPSRDITLQRQLAAARATAAPGPETTLTRETPQGTFRLQGRQADVLAQAEQLPAAVDPTEAGAPVNWQRITDAEGRVLAYNPRTLETRPLMAGGEPIQAPGGQQELAVAQQRARILAARAAPGLETITQIIRQRGGDPPALTNRLDDIPLIGRFFLDEEQQMFETAAEQVVSAILRQESGARIAPDEIKKLTRAMVPQAGDEPGTVRQKLDVLLSSVDALNRMAETGDDSAIQAAIANIEALTGATIPRGGAAPDTASYSPDNPFARMRR